MFDINQNDLYDLVNFRRKDANIVCASVNGQKIVLRNIWRNITMKITRYIMIV